jgi:type IV pilus assembly protein PilW
MSRLSLLQYQPYRHKQMGFSLIELMVAIVIGLLMLVAVLQLFLDITRTNDEMAKTNAQIENGRFTIQLVANDLMHAGFWEGYIPEYDDLTATGVASGYPASFVVPEPCLAYASWTATYKDNLLRMPVQAFSAVPSGCSGIVQNFKAGTDVLVVRYADTSVAAATDPDKVYFQASFCSAASPYVYVLAKTGFTLQKRDCLTTADTRRYIAHIYYIRDYSVTAGDGIPTLMRAEFIGSADPADPEWSVQPLISGVERFRVELGVDDLSDTGAAVDYSAAVTWADPLNKNSPTNRGDGAPDGSFVHCPNTGCTGAQLLNVVSAKLYVLVRSIESTPGYTDAKAYTLGSAVAETLGGGFKRHLYSTSVRLHNVSARRETP